MLHALSMSCFKSILGFQSRRNLALVLSPSTLVLRFDVNRGKTLSFVKVFGNLAVVDRFVHADVEKLLSGFGVVDREKNGRNQILHANEISLPAVLGVKHHRYGSGGFVG